MRQPISSNLTLFSPSTRSATNPNRSEQVKTTQTKVLLSLRGAQAFLEANARRLPTVNATGARRRLDDDIARLSAHAAQQVASDLQARGATKLQRALRLALLRDHMSPIARIAKLELPRTPDVDPFRMPKGKPIVARLAAMAQGMAEAAAPHAEVFIAAGMPVDFIARLTQAADALLESVIYRTASRGRRAGATTGLGTQLSAGRQTVHVLDAFVKTELKDDAALLASWNSVKRVHKVPSRSRIAAAAPVPTSSMAVARIEGDSPLLERGFDHDLLGNGVRRRTHRLAQLFIGMLARHEEPQTRLIVGHGGTDHRLYIDPALEQHLTDAHGTHGVTDDDGNDRGAGTLSDIEPGLAGVTGEPLSIQPQPAHPLGLGAQHSQGGERSGGIGWSDADTVDESRRRVLEVFHER